MSAVLPPTLPLSPANALVGDTSEAEACAICLVIPANCCLRTTCGHRFCPPCLQSYSEANQPDRQLSCPLCKRDLEADLLAEAGVVRLESLPVGSPASDGSPSSDGSPASGAREERAYRRLAAKLHLKRCPNCEAPIYKEGGCNSVHCLNCRHAFRWTDAHTVVTCHRLHLNLADRMDNRWSTIADCCLGTTCPDCSLLAHSKKAVWRTAITPAAVTLAAITYAGYCTEKLTKAAFDKHRALRRAHHQRRMLALENLDFMEGSTFSKQSSLRLERWRNEQATRQLQAWGREEQNTTTVVQLISNPAPPGLYMIADLAITSTYCACLSTTTTTTTTTTHHHHHRHHHHHHHPPPQGPRSSS